MTEGPDLAARVTALETRVDEIAIDAAAARHLAAANDRDLSGLTARMDAHRAAINALGVQTAARFDRMDDRFDRMDDRFDRMDERIAGVEAEMRAGFSVADDNFQTIDDNFRAVATSFAEIRGKLDQTTAGLQQIVTLLTPDDPANPPDNRTQSDQ